VLAGPGEFADAIRAIVGGENVVADPDRREFLSRDLSFEPLQIAEVAVRPGTATEVAAVVNLARRAGVAVVARGGGMTYTQGFPPARRCTVLLDLARLNAVREVSVDDLYVVVEAGCSWEHLYETVRSQGMQTPFAGTSSGRYATVGGTLSTNGVFLGSSRYGTAVESVLGLEVVLGDGRLLRTGSWARRQGVPFSRNFGPDLTGLFLADAGALGVKTAAVLPLMPTMPSQRYASFRFETFAASVDAMREMSRLGLASEIYSFDPHYNSAFVAHGFEHLLGADWSVHLSIDAYDDATADAGLALLRRLGAHRGTELEPSLPAALRTRPFDGVRWALLARDGRVWLPTHAILPFSRAHEAIASVERVLERESAALARHGVSTSYQTVVVGHNWIFEVGLYWHDEVGEFRLDKLDAEERERFRSVPANPDSRALALRVRREISSLLSGLCGVQLQIGKYYDYGEVLEPVAFDVLAATKAALDPDGLLNPDSLGLPVPRPPTMS
jgi:FAD/FMN-containing dehydrogenase